MEFSGEVVVVDDLEVFSLIIDSLSDRIQDDSLVFINGGRVFGGVAVTCEGGSSDFPSISNTVLILEPFPLVEVEAPPSEESSLVKVAAS